VNIGGQWMKGGLGEVEGSGGAGCGPMHACVQPTWWMTQPHLLQKQRVTSVPCVVMSSAPEVIFSPDAGFTAIKCMGETPLFLVQLWQ
jgi:hypothetical protein